MLHEEITSFFQVPPQEVGSQGWKYYIQEENGAYSITEIILSTGTSIELFFNEDDEIRLVLYKDGQPITTIQRIAVQKMDIIKDEESFQFVLDRMPSRMIRLQLKPFLAVEMGLYWEVCEDCE
ncbi:DUF3979 domain-containing protein [Bacillus sp. AFS018417]|uniref:DUF3979 family protein n=1 Tax=Bacillus sp. AFS018417 TaxID=2033491 RepID=UPI000BF46C58|nr:DUF3979 family protein [Bacillus sp. AFS018417]PEZ03328.1 DUF3979 domain-containing protein [Bacillus sp. AFS018417]